MLKLRKVAHDINVIVKDSQGHFTRQLRIAFAIALGIHLFLFSAFQITKLHFNYSESPSLPTTVSTESPTPNGATFANTDTATALDKRIPLPPEPIPTPGSSFDITLTGYESITRRPPTGPNPFEPLENDLLLPPPLYAQNAPTPPIRLIATGDIHSMLLTNNLENVKLPKIPKRFTDLDSRVIFSVAVNSDGLIFWYDTLENTAITPLDSLAENILKTLKFSPNTNDILAKGTIEIHFHLPGNP